jgi:hypothetical protein
MKTKIEAGVLKRRRRLLMVLIGAILLLCSIMFRLFPCSAGKVWSDDFNDGNYDGWTVLGLDATSEPPKRVDVGFISAADNTLRATEGGMSYFNIASHPSSVAIGTWSFDVYITGRSGMSKAFVGFMNAALPPSKSALGYDIGIDLPLLRFVLLKWVGYDFYELGEYAPEGGIADKWWHIDVTRDAEGHFYVYANGTLAMDVVDTEVTTSEYFRFVSESGPALDNIIVSDTVDIEPPLPEAPFYMQTWFLATVGVAVVLVVMGAVWVLRGKIGFS